MFSKIGDLAQRGFRKACDGINQAVDYCRDKAHALLGGGAAGGAAAGGGALVVSEQTAQAAPPTLPDLGVDVGGAITAAAGDLGVVFMTIITIGIVLTVAWIAWSWRKRIRG